MVRALDAATESSSSKVKSEIGEHFETWSGARRDRTADLLNAIQALSQLSYGPTCRTERSMGEGD